LPAKENQNYSTLIQSASISDRDNLIRQIFFSSDRTLSSLGFKRDGIPKFSGYKFEVVYLDKKDNAVYITFDGNSYLSAFIKGRLKSWNNSSKFDEEIEKWISSIISN
jgi:hypothetical protein